jgi:hypothetical protein
MSITCIHAGRVLISFYVKKPFMQSKIHVIDGLTIDHSKSSIEVFPALQALEGSDELYLKFSKNHIKTVAIEDHARLSLDFDLCLIDRALDETVIQLFAIFSVTKNRDPLNEWKYVQSAINFARSLIVDEIARRGLKDKMGHTIIVPVLTLTADAINFSFATDGTD